MDINNNVVVHAQMVRLSHGQPMGTMALVWRLFHLSQTTGILSPGFLVSFQKDICNVKSVLGTGLIFIIGHQFGQTGHWLNIYNRFVCSNPMFWATSSLPAPQTRHTETRSCPGHPCPNTLPGASASVSPQTVTTPSLSRHVERSTLKYVNRTPSSHILYTVTKQNLYCVLVDYLFSYFL